MAEVAVGDGEVGYGVSLVGEVADDGEVVGCAGACSGDEFVDFEFFDGGDEFAGVAEELVDSSGVDAFHGVFAGAGSDDEGVVFAGYEVDGVASDYAADGGVEEGLLVFGDFEADDVAVNGA